MVILIGEKARLAVDAALDDVQRVIRKENARTAGHGYWLKKLNVPDPFGLMSIILGGFGSCFTNATHYFNNLRLDLLWFRRRHGQISIYHQLPKLILRFLQQEN